MIRKGIIKKLVFVALALMIAVLPFMALACPSDDGNGGNGDEVKQPLKVGISAPYTGKAAANGRPMGDGAQDAIKYINEELGGVEGHQIELLFRDNTYDSAKATTIIEEFISSGALLFATQSSAMMTASMTRANEAGLPGIVVFSAPNCTQPAQHIYASFPDYGDQWIAFVNYYLENIWEGTGKPKMAMHLLANPTGFGAKAAAEQFADSLGVEIIGYWEHGSTTTSEIDSLTTIKAMNPDVIYISSIPEATSVIIRNMVSLSMYPGITVGCGGASFTSAMLQLAGPTLAEGVYGIFPTVGWNDSATGMAKMTEYLNANHPDDANNLMYITGWNEGLLIAEILRLAIINTPGGGNALTPQLVESNGFKKLSNYDVEGLQSPASYASGDNRLSKQIKLYQVINGQIAVLGDWIDAPYLDYGYE